MAVAITYTLLVVALASLPLLPQGWLWYLAGLALATLAFAVDVILSSWALRRRLVALRIEPVSDHEPNPSQLRAYLYSTEDAGRPRWRGRSYTSQTKLLGRPLLDVQTNDPFPSQPPASPKPKVARGWIAIGDRADGILLAMGGRARGLVAIGGLAFGGISVGGLAIGLLSLGGLAVGGLAMGGLGTGYLAFGGGAVGWHSSGGGALGWQSACGGLAVAHHAAAGGLAVASEFAVGGQAIAKEANTDLARSVVARDSLQWTLDWYMQHQVLAMVVIACISLAPMLLLPLIYRRDRADRPGTEPNP